MLYAKLRAEAKQRLSRNRLFVSAYVQAKRLYDRRDVPTAKGQVNADRPALTGIIDRNRSLLGAITTWIDKPALERSPVNYGVMDIHHSMIDQVPDPIMNLTDYLCYFASSIRDLSYLEIGVSVGRNLWQVLHTCHGARLTGLDMDILYPVVRSKLQQISVQVGPPQIECFRHDDTNNAVRVVSGDEFDENVWNALKGTKFNLIFSDAMHTPEAILYEWSMLKKLDLIDPNGFTMVWDDLNNQGMRRAFETICQDACARLNITPNQCAVIHVPGWVGRYEPPHGVGVISSHDDFVTSR